MGNRAAIVTEKRDIGIYLHWNGGRDSVEGFLAYCKAHGYRCPERDGYGWARLAQVIGNFFGGSSAVGIDPYDSLDLDNGDNGTYVIRDWEIVGREFIPYEGFKEQGDYDLREFMHGIDEAMPEGERLGEFIDAVEVPTSALRVGDVVWHQDFSGTARHTVVGFGEHHRRQGVPFMDYIDNDGDYSWNQNNYIQGDTVKVPPKTYEAMMERFLPQLG